MQKFFVYLLQIPASILYSFLFCGLLGAVIVLPAQWILSLPWWCVLPILFFGIELYRALVGLAIRLLMVPYIWILHKNAVALVCALLSIVPCFLYSMRCIWLCDFSGLLRTLCALLMIYGIFWTGFTLVMHLLILRKGFSEP